MEHGKKVPWRFHKGFKNLISLKGNEVLGLLQAAQYKQGFGRLSTPSGF
jgi:hypothetical protein